MIKLETQRLIIKDVVLNDFKELCNQGNSKDINYFNWYIPYPFTEKDAKNIILERKVDYKSKNRKIYELAIFLKQTGRLIGIVSFYDYNPSDRKAKVGYWLGEKYRGFGYASEALERLLYFGEKNLRLNKVSANVVIGNKKSIKLLKKYKFKKIGIKRKDKLLDNKYCDIILFEKIFK